MNILITTLFVGLMALLFAILVRFVLRGNPAAGILQFTRPLAQWIPVWILALIVALSAARVKADTFHPNYWKSDTNAFPLTLTNGQGANITGLKFAVRQKVGLSLFVQVASTNTTGVSGAIGLDVTYDNTNGTTTRPLTFQFPSNFNGTNGYWTNWPASVLSNVRTIQPTYATNNAAGSVPLSNSIAIKKLIFSQDND